MHAAGDALSQAFNQVVAGDRRRTDPLIARATTALFAGLTAYVHVLLHATTVGAD